MNGIWTETVDCNTHRPPKPPSAPERIVIQTSDEHDGLRFKSSDVTESSQLRPQRLQN